MKPQLSAWLSFTVVSPALSRQLSRPKKRSEGLFTAVLGSMFQYKCNIYCQPWQLLTSDVFDRELGIP